MKFRYYLLLCVFLAAGCESQRSNYLETQNSGFGLSLASPGSLISIIDIVIKDSLPDGAVLVVRFESPEGEKVYEHLVTPKDRRKGTVRFETKPMDNWDKWGYNIYVDVYSDTSKTNKIDTLVQKTDVQQWVRNTVKMIKAENKPRLPKEKWSFEFDSRQWRVGYEANNGKQSIVENVLQGESIENWSELVTTLLIFDLQKEMTPLKLMQITQAEFNKQSCQNLDWDILQNDTLGVIFEWQHDGCSGFTAQREISRVVAGKDGIYRISYSSKGRHLDKDKRDHWLKSITNAKIVKTK